MSCLFCSLPEATTCELPEDEVIDHSEDFYAKAALGHFVFGYMLVISRDHYISFADLPLPLFPELDAFSYRVAERIQKLTQTTVMMFEHGAVNRPQRAGSCIDHAHLHLFPTADLLIPKLCAQFDFVQLSSHSEVRGFRATETPYLYFRTPGGDQYAASVQPDLPSQFIRRLACECLGCDDLWDWRTNHLREALESFKVRYKELNPR
jgi:diadenosine tetraphosphate (Ap4A) HIT family hydrolase